MSYSRKFVPLPQITAEENEVLAVKYQSPVLGSLTDMELFKAARLILLKIHVIVGWVIPEKELKDILVDQFTKKAKECYSNINADEIEYAFRKNVSVQDWGKNMNLALIDSVIGDYLEKRLDISRLEEKYKTPPELPPPKEDPMSDDEFLEMNYKTWSVLKTYGIISTRCYGILVGQGKIKLTQEEKEEMYTQVETMLINKMKSDRNWHQELNPIYQSPNKDHWKARVFNECKRKAVENYFTTL